eukprot:9747003-Alexandrium_andersonii.AAC.1
MSGVLAQNIATGPGRTSSGRTAAPPTSGGMCEVIARGSGARGVRRGPMRAAAIALATSTCSSTLMAQKPLRPGVRAGGSPT